MAKPTTRKPTTPKRSPARLTPEQAARHVGLTPAELAMTRQRGLPPGILGETLRPGTLTYARRALDEWLAARPAAPGEAADAEPEPTPRSDDD